MSLQYIIDKAGNRNAVIIPIEKWNDIICLYPELGNYIEDLPRKVNDEERPYKINVKELVGLLSKEEAEKMKIEIEELR